MRRAAILATAALVVVAGAAARAVRSPGALVTSAPPVATVAQDTRPDRGDWLRARLADAPAGSVLVVPAGRYLGPFVLDRPLHLRADGAAHLQGDARTHTVAVRAADVTVEGFEITGSGMDLSKDHAAIHVTGARAVIIDNRIHDALHGVYVRQADDVRVEHNTILGTETAQAPLDPFATKASPTGGELCDIDLNQNQRGNGVHVWNSRRVQVARNTIRHTRDGVYFSFVDDSDVRGNLVEGVRYGLHYMYSDHNRFEDNRFRDNAAGAALMSSKHILLRRNVFEANRNHRAYGILLQTVEFSTLDRNRIDGNTTGVFIEGGTGNLLEGNTVARNHVGVHVSDSSDGNRFTANAFVGNLHAVETSGGTFSSSWARNGRGNYWDDAVHLDLGHDGIADLPHRELDLFGRLRRNFPSIGLLAGSPGERLLRFVHARLALPGVPGVVDPAPLVSPDQP
ncbi:NosD protein [Luteitalea sp. TBR-22]|uniref:NosD domain-containing protein n=1 Tax=Luteitalea sp. TBR-22 TaxID=2802971 RepID=UPI001AFA12BB|nr:NosD domain-containing protein [Luteitalea sp. TBR-22]BCS32348.1 NosD protein [Luteitalea sp. TBR-22]